MSFNKITMDDLSVFADEVVAMVEGDDISQKEINDLLANKYTITVNVAGVREDECTVAGDTTIWSAAAHGEAHIRLYRPENYGLEINDILGAEYELGRLSDDGSYWPVTIFNATGDVVLSVTMHGQYE